jgi:hypothetical protein
VNLLPRDSGIVLDTVPITIATPWSRPLVHLALETVIVAIGIATLVHALRARRAGDPLPLFTFATILVYGVVMELLSYNFVDNFVHAQFSVMFYHRKLPLYVTAVYPTLLYLGIATARRFHFPRWAEGFAAGLLIVALDVPFDVTGPVVRWWSWSPTDPLLAARWCGVPVTSYFWHLAFGGILAALTSSIAPHLKTRRKLVLTSFPAALLTIVFGVIAFLPVHGLAAIHVPHGVTVGCALAACTAILVAAPKRPTTSRDPLLLVLVAIFYVFHLAVAAFAVPATHLVFVVVATGFAALVNAFVHGAPLWRARAKVAS